MADPRLFRLRVVFVKAGRLAMLSHLEVAHALERAVRRAGLPFAVSQGFSPHMRIAFGAALPVGVGGTHEFFDLLLTDYVAPDRALASLRAASAADLMPQSCAYVEHSALAASVAFPLSTYEAVLSDAPVRLVVPDEVRVVRKKKEKVLAVADFLVGKVELEGKGDGASAGGDAALADGGALQVGGGARVEGGGARVRFTLEAKPTGSLRPDVLMASCVSATVEAGCAPAGFHMTSMTRIAQRTADGEML